jgi:hypothetical protein
LESGNRAEEGAIHIPRLGALGVLGGFLPRSTRDTTAETGICTQPSCCLVSTQVVTPFGHEPERLSLGRVRTVVVCHHDPLESKAGGKLASAPFSPRVSTQPLSHCQLARLDRIASAPAQRVELPARAPTPDCDVRRDSDAVVHSVLSKRCAKFARITLPRIGEYQPERQSVADSTPNHVESQAVFGLDIEFHIVRDLGVRSPLCVIGPAFRQIWLEVKRRRKTLNRDGNMQLDNRLVAAELALRWNAALTRIRRLRYHGRLV